MMNGKKDCKQPVYKEKTESFVKCSKKIVIEIGSRGKEELKVIKMGSFHVRVDCCAGCVLSYKHLFVLQLLSSVL